MSHELQKRLHLKGYSQHFCTWLARPSAAVHMVTWCTHGAQQCEAQSRDNEAPSGRGCLIWLLMLNKGPFQQKMLILSDRLRRRWRGEEQREKERSGENKREERGYPIRPWGNSLEHVVSPDDYNMEHVKHLDEAWCCDDNRACLKSDRM